MEWSNKTHCKKKWLKNSLCRWKIEIQNSNRVHTWKTKGICKLIIIIKQTYAIKISHFNPISSWSLIHSFKREKEKEKGEEENLERPFYPFESLTQLGPWICKCSCNLKQKVWRIYLMFPDLCVSNRDLILISRTWAVQLEVQVLLIWFWTSKP